MTLPPIIQKVGFDFSWNEKDIWILPIPVSTMPINDLKWHFDIPFWNDKTGSYNLSPFDVMSRPDHFSEHMSRIQTADTSYPIDVALNPKTQLWTILDGLHRLVKHSLAGVEIVPARKIPLDMIRKEILSA